LLEKWRDENVNTTRPARLLEENLVFETKIASRWPSLKVFSKRFYISRPRHTACSVQARSTTGETILDFCARARRQKNGETFHRQLIGKTNQGPASSPQLGPFFRGGKGGGGGKNPD